MKPSFFFIMHLSLLTYLYFIWLLLFRQTSSNKLIADRIFRICFSSICDDKKSYRSRLAWKETSEWNIRNSGSAHDIRCDKLRGRLTRLRRIGDGIKSQWRSTDSRQFNWKLTRLFRMEQSEISPAPRRITKVKSSILIYISWVHGHLTSKNDRAVNFIYSNDRNADLRCYYFWNLL